MYVHWCWSSSPERSVPTAQLLAFAEGKKAQAAVAAKQSLAVAAAVAAAEAGHQRMTLISLPLPFTMAPHHRPLLSSHPHQLTQPLCLCVSNV